MRRLLVRQVNPDSVFTEFGFSDMGGLEMISGASAMGMQNFNALPGDPVLFEEQYDVLKGVGLRIKMRLWLC